MARPKSAVPALSHHKQTGQARVRIDGRDHYLGPFGSSEADERYRRLVAEWLTTGSVPSKRPAGTPEPGASVNEVILAYVRFARGYYVKDGEPTSELRVILDTLALLRGHYGRTAAADFGPLKLKALREAMIGKGWCRGSVNGRVGRIKRCFKWAVENELVPASVHHGLSAVAGLRQGRSAAAESVPVGPVDQADVNAVLPFLNRQLLSMVKLQAYTGMRPGEVCQLRPCDLDTGGEVWTYRPASHKTQHHGRSRTVFIGPRGQSILAPWLENRPAAAFCFSPAEAEAERRAAMTAARVTPRSCGNRPGTNRRRKPRSRPGERYRTQSYGAAIRDACRKAGIGVWSPNRLRHSAATAVRRSFGLEGAQVMLGHASADVTQVYAERDHDLARRVAAEVG